MSNLYDNFQQIPQLTRSGSYQVNTQWKYLEDWIKSMEEDLNLQLEPIFQRGHVWTREQQIAYVEYILRGGNTSKIIYFNYPSWHANVKDGEYNEFVCVDGLQRLTAVRAFMSNKIPAFGTYYKDYSGRLPTDAELLLNINDLHSAEEVLQWYIDLNSGETPHSKEEIERVRRMLGYQSKEIEEIAKGIVPGATVYWVVYGQKEIRKCTVTDVKMHYNTISSFKVNFDDKKDDAMLLGDTIGDLIFLDLESAKARDDYFRGDSFHE